MNFGQIITQHWLHIIFGAIILLFLIADLGIFQKRPHKLSFTSAVIQSVFWISISIGFGILVYFNKGSEPGFQFMSAYLMEWSLSVDNIFIFLLIFRFFNTEEKYYHKVLFWGIWGAIVFRLIFISVGSVLVHQFHWILYLFGIVLVITGIRMLMMKRDKQFQPDKNFVYRQLKKYLRFGVDDGKGSFIYKLNGKIFFTPLFLVVALIETSDIIFAIDSIPAVFSISQDTFIVYTSNIFAVMGLRAMFILLGSFINKFRYLHQGISFILIFIGTKMLAEILEYKLPTLYSLIVILLVIGLSMLISALNPRKEKL